MAEQYTPNLGAAPDVSAMRDAIHIAVAPVVAGEQLHPGDRVFLVYGKAYRANHGEEIGLVDPFLTMPVLPEKRFWLCLKPGTITGLRHAWSHPAFQPKPPSE